MNYSFLKRISLTLLAVGSLLFTACNGVPLPTDDKDATCPSAPKNISLVTIKSIVDWVNAMEKPLTLPCFVQSLPRPLKVNTSTFASSAQPPLGAADPRVFLFFDKLILSIVTNKKVTKDGVPPELQEHLLEFSYVTDWDKALSIKGELVFPITELITEEDAYTRVLPKVPLGSLNNCNVCHRKETQVDTIGNTPVYESEVLKSLRGVELDDLKWYNSRCVPEDQPHRCRMYSSLVDFGDLQQADFPVNARTLTNN